MPKKSGGRLSVSHVYDVVLGLVPRLVVYSPENSAAVHEALSEALETAKQLPDDKMLAGLIVDLKAIVEKYDLVMDKQEQAKLAVTDVSGGKVLPGDESLQHPVGFRDDHDLTRHFEWEEAL